jgi:hypothetical protein
MKFAFVLMSAPNEPPCLVEVHNIGGCQARIAALERKVAELEEGIDARDAIIGPLNPMYYDPGHQG